VPASVEMLGRECFSDCGSLAHLTFESGSRISRIAARAFDRCPILKSVSIPASLEILHELFVKNCRSMSTLTFEKPSKLRIVSIVPPECLSFISIPDSVEFLRCVIDLQPTSHFVLDFGVKSNLRAIGLPRSDFPDLYKCPSKDSLRHRAFVRLSQFTLKEFRSTLEFYDGCLEDYICFSDSVPQKLDFQQQFEDVDD
jgi:hypothetical protein